MLWSANIPPQFTNLIKIGYQKEPIEKFELVTNSATYEIFVDNKYKKYVVFVKYGGHMCNIQNQQQLIKFLKIC